MKKILSAILLTALLLTSSSMIACSSGDDPSSGTQNTEGGDTTVSEETTAADPFASYDYNGREFRIYTSTNNPGGSVTNSNHMIEGSGELTGDLVNDAVYDRNLATMEALNIQLVFEQVNMNYDTISGHINTIIMSGDDAYDLIINDLFPMAELSAQNLFRNIYDGANFDFTQNYWYSDYMQDLQFVNGYANILAGDFFMDILRSAHCLIYNRNLMEDLYQDPDLVYSYVLDGSWTLDTMNTLVEGAYLDINGNSESDNDDIFGYIAHQIWGPSIPFLMSSGIQFVTRDADGIPVITVENERSHLLIEKLNQLFYNTGANPWIDENQMQTKFAGGSALFIGNQRLGSLESATIRDMEYDIGIVPYPKLDETQTSYSTSSHDTTEIGVIPMTVTDMDFVSAVIEVLNRETMKTVLPNYYETALKVKYTRDETSAQMIDIIHDNIKSSFPLAYSYALNNIFLQGTFYFGSLDSNTDGFSAKYASLEKGALTSLEKLVSQYIANAES